MIEVTNDLDRAMAFSSFYAAKDYAMTNVHGWPGWFASHTGTHWVVILAPGGPYLAAK